MDARDLSIVTQVAFKGAIEAERDIDLASDEGQERFERVFSFLCDSLMMAIRSGEDPATQVAQVIQGQFPGSQVISGPNGPLGQPPYTTPAPPQFGVAVKGTQHGPLPDWLFEEAAKVGVTEVYDNRDRAMGTKRPWFRATTGGDNAKPFWPPR